MWCYYPVELDKIWNRHFQNLFKNIYYYKKNAMITFILTVKYENSEILGDIKIKIHKKTDKLKGYTKMDLIS